MNKEDVNQEDYLCHYGVLGMKWGRRKQRVSSGTRKKSSNKKSNVKSNKKSNLKTKVSKTLSKIDKEKVKSIAKTSAVITGKVAIGALLGTYGGMLGISILNGYADARNRRYIEAFGDSYLRGLRSRYM